MDLLKAIEATNLDFDEKFRLIGGRLDQMDAGGNLMQAQILELQEWRRRSGGACELRVEKLIRPLLDEHTKEHRDFHDAYVASIPTRRAGDPPDSEFTGVRESAFPHLSPEQTTLLQVIAGMSALKKAATIVVTALLIGLTGMSLSYLGSSLVEDNREGQPTPAITHTVTASPSSQGE